MEETKQLELSQHELEVIGFTGKHYPADEDEPARVCYSIPVINGEFIYNKIGEYKDRSTKEQYKWCLKNTTGEAANYIWLNIERVEELYIVLSCFRVKYNLVML
jgi:hypothetical protein